MEGNLNNSYIKSFIDKYLPGDNLIKPDKEILDYGSKLLPKEIIDLWKEYGFGDYGNGILKIVDPRSYMDSLYSWLGKIDYNKIPLIVTAFGDIFYYRKLSDTDYDISLLDVHYRKISVCSYNCKDFFENYITSLDVIKIILRNDLYNDAVKKYGYLNHNEIFYFVPALVIGGQEDLKNIGKGIASVHHQVLLQLGK